MRNWSCLRDFLHITTQYEATHTTVLPCFSLQLPVIKRLKGANSIYRYVCHRIPIGWPPMGGGAILLPEGFNARLPPNSVNFPPLPQFHPHTPMDTTSLFFTSNGYLLSKKANTWEDYFNGIHHTFRYIWMLSAKEDKGKATSCSERSYHCLFYFYFSKTILTLIIWQRNLFASIKQCDKIDPRAIFLLQQL